MIHALLAIGLLAAAVGFVFGERFARIFVGSVLAVMACGVLLVAYVSFIDTQRQLDRRPAYVTSGSER
jgi:uncharacterized membrane protein YidH (DUF202 family)